MVGETCWQLILWYETTGNICAIYVLYVTPFANCYKIEINDPAIAAKKLRQQYIKQLVIYMYYVLYMYMHVLSVTHF